MADAGEIRIDISEPIMNAIAHKVAPMQAVHVVKDDPSDNRILECAVEARSDCVVTGDKDLLRLGQHESIRILNASELLDLVHDQGRTL